MRFEFDDDKLAALYTDEKGAHKYPVGVVDSFFEVMDHIKAANNEQDLRAFKSLRFERLSGQRKHQHSLRLNDQYRLVVELQDDERGKFLLIISLEDYH